MKRVRVYQQIRSEENLRLAIQEVCASHRRNGDHSLNKKVLEIEANLDDYVKKLDKFIQDLVSGDAHMNKPIKRRRWDRNADNGKGKWRDINEPLLWPDQCVHHAVLQPMIPHIMRSMDRYCIASVPGRGNSYGVKTIKKWMKNDPVGTRYALECDIYHCFEELDPPHVINALKRLFKDQETLWLCDAMMEYGVLIGAFFSAWFLHLTLQPLDLMIHDKKYGVSHSIRQMDNFTIFSSNKRKLRKLFEDMNAWLAEIGLKLKGTWQVFRVGFTPKVEREHALLPEKKAAPPPSENAVGSGIPVWARLYHSAKAQPVPAEAGPARLLLPERPEPGHLVQEGIWSDLQAGSAPKMQQPENIGAVLPAQDDVRFEEGCPKGMQEASSTIPALCGGIKE